MIEKLIQSLVRCMIHAQNNNSINHHINRHFQKSTRLPGIQQEENSLLDLFFVTDVHLFK